MAGRDATIERICQAALEREPASRATFVAEACGGDHTLRRDVDALLAHATAAERFIEAPALVVAARQFVEGGAIRSGTRIGPYEVLSLLGAGGMGEVYRARDGNLQRDVAIKLLPSLFSRDPDRLARFERESRVLASLNHPNIAAIYAVERLDDRRALVLEFVEGPTLADRVAHGPLPLHETLAIAKQIAEALDAAHEKGIVHRDLKPANVKIAPGAASSKSSISGWPRPRAGNPELMPILRMPRIAAEQTVSGGNPRTAREPPNNFL
jgi:eukaryotic-like serine/threonine-protein kinase